MTRILLLLLIPILTATAGCSQRKPGDGATPDLAPAPTITHPKDRNIKILGLDAGVDDHATTGEEPGAPADNLQNLGSEADAGASANSSLEEPPKDETEGGPPNDKQPPPTKDRKSKYNEDFGVE